MILEKDFNLATDMCKTLLKMYPEHTAESFHSLMSVLSICSAHVIFNSVNENCYEELLDSLKSNIEICLDHIREKYREEHEQQS